MTHRSTFAIPPLARAAVAFTLAAALAAPAAAQEYRLGIVTFLSGGAAGPGSALVGLRTVGRGLAAWVLPKQVAISSARTAFDASGQPISADIGKRLHELGHELARYARLHAAIRREG